LENKQCVGACLTNPPGSGSSGYTYTFSVVPVPAAVWLFGSALGLLGVARRQRKA
jgi:hypothetical protein